MDDWVSHFVVVRRFQFSETVVGDETFSLLLGSAVVGAKRGGDTRRCQATDCSFMFTALKRLGWSTYNAFIWSDLVNLFVDESVLVPVF